MGQQTIKMGDLVENVFRGINANFTDIELTKATKEELAQMQAAVFTFKGTLETFAELPTTDNKVGDVYFVTENESEHAWNGAAWSELGTVADPYTLPVGGIVLGGVKNGGDVTIAPDGTMNAVPSSVTLTKIEFTETSPEWGNLAANKYTLTVPSHNRSPIGVYRKNELIYSTCLCDISLSGDNILIASYDKFEGYILAI